MKLDAKGLKFRCDNCGEEEEGRFMGNIDLNFPPRDWISSRDGKHMCNTECLYEYLHKS